MLTLESKKAISFNPAKYRVEGSCLSSDTKPTGNDIANGSFLLEIDTSTVYFYDEHNKLWRAWE